MVVWSYEKTITQRNESIHIVSVDKENFGLLNQSGWYVGQSGNTFYCNKRDGRYIKSLHRVIMGLERGDKRVVDHIDGNGLNNLRSNLRVCTNQENIRNTRKYSNNTSGFKGVSYHKRDNKWRAHIRYNKRLIYLGSFDNPEEASKVYQEKAKGLFREFARV